MSGTTYNLENGGSPVSADRIKFLPPKSPNSGYFAILVDGKEVTKEEGIRACMYPARLETPEHMVALLVSGFGDSKKHAFFCDGRVTEWTPYEAGLPKVVDVTPEGIKSKVGAGEMVLSFVGAESPGQAKAVA